MSREQLKQEVNAGVQFWGFEEDCTLIGVMGIQDKGDITLIRHAYVRSRMRNRGIGSRLLTGGCTVSIVLLTKIIRLQYSRRIG